MGIMMAAARGDLDTFKQHLDEGGDVDVTDESGGTALGIAAMIGHSELVTWLLERGADPNHQNLEGNGPLTGAGLFGRLDTTQLLLEAGADPRQQNLKGETPIQIASYQWSPELQGLVEFVSGMLQVDTDLERVRTNRPKVARMMREWNGENPD